MEKITPLVDLAFKKLFGVEENKDLLISLVNAIISPMDQLSDLVLLNPYNAQSFRNDKWSVLDIKARSLDGRFFNIEIQLNNDEDYDKRALYYWSKLYTGQLALAQSYNNLQKTIGIHILNFVSIIDTPKYHNVFDIRERECNIPYFEDLELHTIELKKFNDNHREELSDMVDKIQTSLDRWVTFLTRNDLLNKEQLPQALSDPSLKKALGILEVMNFTSEEREAYEGHLKWLMTEASVLKTAENKGREKGLAEGRAEGRAEFIQIMLAQGHRIETIAKFTGLSVDQINKLC